MFDLNRFVRGTIKRVLVGIVPTNVLLGVASLGIYTFYLRLMILTVNKAVFTYQFHTSQSVISFFIPDGHVVVKIFLYFQIR